MTRFVATRRAASLAAVSLFALSSAAPAFAQDSQTPQAQGDQEIVVTATKREVNLQDVCRATSPAFRSRISGRGKARSPCAASPQARSSATSRA